jgi:hypothetical protein
MKEQNARARCEESNRLVATGLRKCQMNELNSEPCENELSD